MSETYYTAEEWCVLRPGGDHVGEAAHRHDAEHIAAELNRLAAERDAAWAEVERLRAVVAKYATADGVVPDDVMAVWHPAWGLAWFDPRTEGMATLDHRYVEMDEHGETRTVYGARLCDCYSTESAARAAKGGV